VVGKILAHYRVIEKLGAGGMGEVYRAHDEQLRREVAIKVLPASRFMDAAARAQLVREARLAAALNHPHICTIYEVGEADGQVYIAMELVAGQPLQRRIPAGGMPVDQVLCYGVQIADAVAHAHARRVVHRDLKTGNIVVTPQGRAKVLDFGLAKRAIGDEFGETLPESQASLTDAVGPVGTLPYMAPEQLRGQGADERSDVWALGVVLHEMAAGARPFQGRTRLELGSAILHQRPKPLPQHVTPDVRAVINRCLQKEPERRYQRAGEVSAALEAIQTGATPPEAARLTRPDRRAWLAAASWLLAVVGACALGIGWWVVSHSGGGSPRLDSIAVLPFANLTRSAEQQPFVDAMHDAVIAELAQLRSLTVISRQSVLRYRETQKSLPDIARELRVDGVVQGSVFRVGDTVRITVQVLEVLPVERHLWTGTFQQDLRDILTLQSDVARGISEQVRVTVSPDELQRLARARPVNPAAYEAWLRAWVERNRTTGPAVERCIEHANEAVAIDPDYGAAYALAADCHLFRLWTGATPAPPWEAFPQAKAAARHAVAVDPSLGSAHALLGFTLGAFDWEWSGADRAFKRALELSPGDASSHSWYSYFLNWMGRHDEAIEHARFAERLSPGSPHVYLTAALLWARRYDEGLAHARRTVELFPDYGFGHEWLSWAYDFKGMYQESLAAQHEAVRLMGATDINRTALLGRAYARAGRPVDALEILDQLLRLRRTTYVHPVLFAYLQIGLHQTGEAIDWLERGYEDRDPDIAFLKTFPPFDPLRSDTRFRALLRRLKFP
jgi:serine/threonine protein kinase/tetratricopeptide (TPR) repeat protein